MRRLALVVLGWWLGLSGDARADGLGPLAPEIKAAAAAHKPLVVELHAAWCAPCLLFESEVLPTREVQAALGGVRFARFDIDTPRGAAISEHYRARSVPTFLIIGPDGGAEVVHAGVGGRAAQGGDGRVAWFVGFLESAGRASERTAALRRALAAAPDDHAARLALAEHYVSQQRPAAAIGELQRIVDSTAPRELKARAALRLDALVAADVRVASEVEAAHQFVRAFPESPLASERLAFLAASGRLEGAALRALARSHVEHAPVTEPGPLRAAILVGIYGDVDRGLRARIAATHDEPAARLTRAEMLLHEGLADGREMIAMTCARPPPHLQLRCFQLESGLALGMKQPGVESLRRRASALLADLETPGEAAAASLANFVDTSDPFGNAVAGAVRRAGKACTGQSDRPGGEVVVVELTVEAGGGRPRNVDAFPRGALASCVSRSLSTDELPASPPGLGGELTAVVPVAGGADEARDGTDGGGGSSRSIPHGAVFQGRARAGAVSSVGVGVEGVSGRTRLADLRLMLGYEAEAGMSADRGATYGGRGLIGAGLALGRASSIAVLVGAGATAHGDALPLAFEVPLVLRAQIGVGRQRLHLWTRSSYLFGDRAASAPSLLLEGDEIAAGAAFTANLDGARVFVGAAYEDRSTGSDVMVLFGLPVGGYF